MQAEMKENKVNNSPEGADDSLESMKKELAECLITQNEWKERALRATADLENARRRMEKDQSLWLYRSQSHLLSQLLPIIDNFDRAMAHVGDNEGLIMIHAAFHDFLKNNGVKEVSYETFNPVFHEAVMQVESAEHTPGTIVTIFEKGYMLQDQVLRPAKVSVAK